MQSIDIKKLLQLLLLLFSFLAYLQFSINKLSQILRNYLPNIILTIKQ